MNSIIKREQELFNETCRLRSVTFEMTKTRKQNKENFDKVREIQKKEIELYKKQQFFKNYLKEMEKMKND